MNTHNQTRIVTEAVSWLGTPYHHMGDVKGSGVDCAMLLVRVFCDVGLVPKIDPRPYPGQFYLHSDEPRYLRWIMEYSDQVKDSRPGDVALFKFGRCISHAGIVIDYDLMVHAEQKSCSVVKSEILSSPMYVQRLVGYWRVHDGL
ncbi:MAG: C40 family peptidase [Ktedonobacteraceae bacterium]